jgi:hypothetical protein
MRAADWPAREGWWCPASANVDFYSIVKEPRRGERLIGEEPRAQNTVRFFGDQGSLAQFLFGTASEGPTPARLVAAKGAFG